MIKIANYLSCLSWWFNHNVEVAVTGLRAWRLYITLAEVKASAKQIRGEIAEVTDLLNQNLVLTDSISTHLVIESLLYQLLDSMRQALAVDTVTVLLQTEDKQVLTVRATRGLEEEITQGIKIPLGKGFAGRIAAKCKPTIVDDLSTIEVVSPILRHSGLQSMLGVPLFSKNRLIGVFHVGTLRPHQFTKQDVRLLQFIADDIGAAIAQLGVDDTPRTKNYVLVPENDLTSLSVLSYLIRNFLFYSWFKKYEQLAIAIT